MQISQVKQLVKHTQKRQDATDNIVRHPKGTIPGGVCLQEGQNALSWMDNTEHSPKQARTTEYWFLPSQSQNHAPIQLNQAPEY